MKELIGQSIGRYHILEQLGEGGMATVYKAYDTRLEREVALKLIRTEQFPPAQLERVLKRFEREAKILARLDHLHIVKVYDYGEHEGSPYLVMQYVPSGSLREQTGKPMPWQQAVRVLLPIARALAYAHQQGMIHRDVKPGNILITQSGEAMLSDFGIARILESGGSETLTTSGVGVGTPEYMAPEQWLNQTTEKTDIYALGVVLYELVTGRKPYTADTPAAVLLKQSNDHLPRPRQWVKDLPDEVEKVIFKAMAKKPADRYTEMSAFAKALDSLLKTEVGENESREYEPLFRRADEQGQNAEPPTLDKVPKTRNKGVRQGWKMAAVLLFLPLFFLLVFILFSDRGGTQVSGIEMPTVTPATSSTVIQSNNLTLSPTQSIIPTSTESSLPLAGPVPKEKQRLISQENIEQIRIISTIPGDLNLGYWTLSPDGTIAVLSRGARNELIQWDLRSGKEVQRNKIEINNSISQVAFSNKGDIYAVAMTNGNIEIINGIENQKNYTIEESYNNEEYFTIVAFSPDDEYLAYTNNEMEIVIRETSTWNEVYRIVVFPDRKELVGRQFNSLNYSSDGKYIIVSNSSRDVAIFRIPDMKDIYKYQFKDIRDTYFEIQQDQIVFADGSELKIVNYVSGIPTCNLVFSDEISGLKLKNNIAIVRLGRWHVKYGTNTITSNPYAVGIADISECKIIHSNIVPYSASQKLGGIELASSGDLFVVAPQVYDQIKIYATISGKLLKTLDPGVKGIYLSGQSGYYYDYGYLKFEYGSYIIGYYSDRSLRIWGIPEE